MPQFADLPDGGAAEKLISLFHYALNPKGNIFLGTSETVGEFGSTLFSALSRKWKLYQRIDEITGAVRPAMEDFASVLPGKTDRGLPARPAEDAGRGNLKTLVEQTLLTHYAQAGILINGRGEILHIYGRTGKYLEPAAGNAAMNILLMAREGLRLP